MSNAVSGVILETIPALAGITSHIRDILLDELAGTAISISNGVKWQSRPATSLSTSVCSSISASYKLSLSFNIPSETDIYVRIFGLASGIRENPVSSRKIVNFRSSMVELPECSL